MNDILQAIYALLPDNLSKKITAKDLREALGLMDSKITDAAETITLIAATGAQSLGTITTASTIPAEGNVWAFAAPGTYPNAGNLTVSPNTVGILTRVGGAWSKVEVALPKANAIEDWSAKAFTAGSNVFYGGKIYTNTANALSTDVPGVASVWKVKVEADAVKLFDAAIVSKSGITQVNNYGFGTDADLQSSYRCIWIDQTPVKHKGFLSEISILTDNVNLLPFFVFRPKGGNNFQNVKSFELLLQPNSLNTIDVSAHEIFMEEGDFLGVGCNGVNIIKTDTTKGTSLGYNTGWAGWTEGVTVTFGSVQNFSHSYTYKVKNVGLTGDEVISLLKKMKDNGAAKDIYINAESFGVAASNTAEKNTQALNAAFSAAKSLYKAIVLPSGIIKHNGLNFPEGTILMGQGINKTTLLNESGSNALYDADASNSNNFINGALLQDLTIDGGNVADYGLNIRNHFFITVERVVFRRFKKHCVRYEGVLTPLFNMVKFQESENGVFLMNSTSSRVGAMAANMSRFTMCYFVEIRTQCAEITRGSNIVFDQCNFEGAGIAGDNNTGAIKAYNISPNGEGTDIVVINGWSEGIRGSFLNISNSTGRTIVHNQMIFRGGNGAAGNGTAIVNNGCNVLVSGTTKVTGYTQGVLTNGGKTFTDGFADVGSHTEQNGGIFKTATYQ